MIVFDNKRARHSRRQSVRIKLALCEVVYEQDLEDHRTKQLLL